MAKIIEMGVIKNFVAQFRCPKCQTLAEFYKDDIQYDRDGNYVVCPLCSKFLDETLLVFKSEDEWAQQHGKSL